MKEKINITNFAGVRDSIIEFLRRKSLIPIVGSGFSLNSPTAAGGKVPGGRQMKEHVISRLKSHEGFTEEEKSGFAASGFPRLCGYYFDNDIIPAEESLSYLRTNFFKAELDDHRKKFLEIDWPYIYSLNIDDAIENSSGFTPLLPCREIGEFAFDSQKRVIKLHGDISEIISYKDARKVFDSKEYALSIKNNAWLLAKLQHDYVNLNIIFLGCSLDDELDLNALEAQKINLQDRGVVNRRFYFTAGDVSLSKLSVLKSYSITDIVRFDCHEDIYRELCSAWEESGQATSEELEQYSAFAVSRNEGNPDEDRQYLLWGKNPFRKNEIRIPSFWIQRKNLHNLVDKSSLLDRRLHIVLGNRISGKTYYLIELFKLFPGRRRYIFANGVRLNRKAFDDLLANSGTLFFFDANSLAEDQFAAVINNLEVSDNYFFIVLAGNENPLELSLAKCLQDGEINCGQIQYHELSNKFDITELNAINRLLPAAKLPLFDNDPIIGNIVRIGNDLDLRHRFDDRSIKIDTVRDIAFLILLATVKSITTFQLFKFDLNQEWYARKAHYSPLIEEIGRNAFEKDAAENSERRIVLNAHLWLYRELGKFAAAPHNIDLIADAYVYLVQKTRGFTEGRPAERRRLMKTLTYFETMNSIFIKSVPGQSALIKRIYAALYSTLCNDFNYLHQSAKCDLWTSNRNLPERLNELKDAQRKIVIALSIARRDYDKSGNDSIKISIDHMDFTHATILSELIILDPGSCSKQICDALDCIQKALESPYNRGWEGKQGKKRNPQRIADMLNMIITRQELLKKMTAGYRTLCSHLWQQISEMLRSS